LAATFKNDAAAKMNGIAEAFAEQSKSWEKAGHPGWFIELYG
jgi:hypothetical protein